MATDRPNLRRPCLERWEVVTVALTLLAFVAIALLIVGKGAPLGHDESVYALKTRHLVEGASSAYYWNDFRAPGFPAALTVPYRIHGTEPVLRLAVAAFGGLLVLLTWVVGRAMLGRPAGVVAAIGMAATPAFVASATEVWPDVPGAALGLAVLAVMYFALARPRVSWWLVAAAPLAVLATLVRYGAPLPIGAGALVLLAAYRRSAMARPLPVLVTGSLALAGIATVLFVPSVTGSTVSPWSSIRALQAKNDLPITQGIVDYVQQADFLVFSIAGVVLLLGLVTAVLGAREDRIDRASVTVAAGIGGLTLLGILLTLHGEYRYLMPVYPWMWIVAGGGLVAAGSQLARNWRGAAAAVLAVGLVFGALADGDAAAVQTIERFRPLRAAGRVIEADAGGRLCGVVTSYVPQLSWYSGCPTRDFELDRVVVDSGSFPDEGPRYLVVVADGKRQPEGSLLDAYLAETEGLLTTVGEIEDGPLGYVEIYRLRR